MSFLRQRGMKGTWHYYTYVTTLVEGKPKQIQDSFSLHTADKELAKLRQTEEDSKRMRGETSVVNDKITWTSFEKEILNEYNKPPLGEQDSTYQKYKYALEHFKELINPVFVAKITARDISRWMQLRTQATKDKAETKQISLTTVFIEYRCLRHAFNLAVTYGWIQKNPVLEIAVPKPPKRLKRILTQEEQGKLLSAARLEDPQLHLMALVFLYTGLRLNEVIHLRWENISLDKSSLDLKAFEDFRLKDREERTIPLFPNLSLALKGAWKAQQWVFTNTSGGLCDRWVITRKFNRLYEKAGILNAKGVHILRHTFCTWGLDFIPLDVMQDLMGHANTSTTKGYSQATEKRKQEAINRLPVILEAVPELKVIG